MGVPGTTMKGAPLYIEQRSDKENAKEIKKKKNKTVLLCTANNWRGCIYAYKYTFIGVYACVMRCIDMHVCGCTFAQKLQQQAMRDECVHVCVHLQQ